MKAGRALVNDSLSQSIPLPASLQAPFTSSNLNPLAKPFSISPPQPTFKNHGSFKKFKCPTKYSHLKILSTNARSLVPKITELRTVANSTKPDIIAVTETWLTESVPDAVLSFPGYNTVVRTDRPSCQQKRGGGVCLLIADSLQVRQRSDLQVWPESVWIELTSQSDRPTVIGCVYRPPSSDLPTFMHNLEDTIQKCHHSNIVVVGDFNAKSPEWLPSDSSNIAGRELAPVFLQLGLRQCVSTPTRLLSDGRLDSLLDLVITNVPQLVLSTETLPPLGSSDHLCVFCELDLSVHQKVNNSTTRRRIWRYDRVDFEDLNSILVNADWDQALQTEDVNDAFSMWTSKFFGIVAQHIPSKIVKKIKPKNPYVTPEIETAIKAKRSALRKLRKDTTAETQDKFKQLRNRVTHLLRKSERAHATKLFRQARLQPSETASKSFWQHMKEVQGKSKQTVIPKLISNDITATTDLEKAEVLNGFFSSQTILPNCGTSLPDKLSLPQNTRSFNTLHTTPKEVFDILSHLKKGKAPGIDDITPDLLRLCAKGIAESLSALFNKSFASSTFPTQWKMALVVPIFKKGDKCNPSNYRPISLLPVLSKVLERVVHEKLSNFLRPWLIKNQSGFKKADGTVPQLVRLTQEWSNAVDDGRYVAAVFFDLKKAFDRVWHEGLFVKLRAAGIEGAALRWLVSFLADRHQMTMVNGTMSTSAKLFAGVPQGAILSPLLFSIYMNDIPFPKSTNLFADDTSSFVTDSVPSLLESKLQERTDSLSIWFAKWHLTVNPTKSAVMVFRSRKMQAVNICITVDSHQVPQVSHHRHLGVTFSDTLGWTSHVDTIVRAASAKVGFLRRLRKRLNPLIMRQLYITCIRPSLEYASIAWGGLTRRDEEKLEKCNRSAARLISNISPSADIPREIVLARAGLPTMDSRRKASQVRLAQAAVRGRLPDHLLGTFSSWTVPASTHSMPQRSHQIIRLPRPKKEIQRRSPLYCAFTLWNSLPADLQRVPNWNSLIKFFTNTI